MKRFMLLYIVVAVLPVAAAPSFTAQIGGDFFNYEENFLDLGLSIVNPIAEDMEFFLTGHFAVSTYQTDGEIEANFFYPIDAGLNFLFPFRPNLTALLGIGASPQFLLGDETRFFFGPFLKGGVRLKIHPVMQWMLEVQQDLVIGAPKWINSGTRVATGIMFSFSSPSPSSKQ